MYGIDSDIKKFIDKKIDKNKTFLKNLTFYNEDYKLVSMFDSDINANLSPQRYFAEVANRVNTLFKISQELDLVPAFLTVTCPGEFHPSSDNYNGYSPKKSSLYLSKFWGSFRHLKIFKHIKKSSGQNMIYIRVFEPHKSGVPHLHAMIFIPRSYMKEVKSKFFEHYDKHGFKKVGLKFINNFKHAKYEDSKGAIAYILKYMNKTFRNAKDGLMSDVAYYFAYHGIRRFITSQTLVPLWIYRKVKHSEENRDLYKLTKDYFLGNVYSSFDKEFITKRFLYTKTQFEDNVIIDSENEVREKVIYQKNHFISNQFLVSSKKIEKIPSTWITKKRIIPIFQDGKIIKHFYNGKIYNYKKHITQMNVLELLSYFNNYDIENLSYIHYLSVRNLLITRGIIDGKIYNLNNFIFKDFLF